MLTFCAFVGCLLGTSAPPRLPGAAVITTRYRVESSTETTVDLSGLGQPNTQNNLAQVSWITVTVGDTAGGRTVHVVVDSIRIDGGAGILTGAADSARGGILHGFLDPTSRLKNLTTSPNENGLLADLQGIVHALFPRILPGATAGTAWTDTLEVPNTAGGANLISRFTINYTAGERETVAGVAALRVNAVTQAKVSGTLENPMAGTMEMEGTLSGNSSFLVSADGRFWGGTATATSDGIVRVAIAPSPIPVRTLRTTTITVLR